MGIQLDFNDWGNLSTAGYHLNTLLHLRSKQADPHNHIHTFQWLFHVKLPC